MIESKPRFAIGDTPYLDGCFTEEYFIRGMTLQRIGTELGLPQYQLSDGAFIAFALQLPSFNGFQLGGWTEFRASKFVDFRNGKKKWSKAKFEKTYQGKRLPISLEDAKKGWMKNMRNEKLVKVLPNIPPHENEKYPAGGLASQVIITHPIQCQVVKFLKHNEIFRSVWG